MQDHKVALTEVLYHNSLFDPIYFLEFEWDKTRWKITYRFDHNRDNGLTSSTTSDTEFGIVPEMQACIDICNAARNEQPMITTIRCTCEGDDWNIQMIFEK